MTHKIRLTESLESLHIQIYASSPIPNNVNMDVNIQNVRSADLPDIIIDEITSYLSLMKTNRISGENGITRKMIIIGGTATFQ